MFSWSWAIAMPGMFSASGTARHLDPGICMLLRGGTEAVVELRAPKVEPEPAPSPAIEDCRWRSASGWGGSGRRGGGRTRADASPHREPVGGQLPAHRRRAHVLRWLLHHHSKRLRTAQACRSSLRRRLRGRGGGAPSADGRARMRRGQLCTFAPSCENCSSRKQQERTARGGMKRSVG